MKAAEHSRRTKLIKSLTAAFQPYGLSEGASRHITADACASQRDWTILFGHAAARTAPAALRPRALRHSHAASAIGGIARHMSRQAPLPARSSAVAAYGSIRSVASSIPEALVRVSGAPVTRASSATASAFVSFAQ
jgi:hypothetical protein